MKKDIYYKRRKKLLNQINGVAVIESASYKIRSNDTEYPYRQDSNFYYLSGFLENNSILMLINKKGMKKSILFVQKKEPQLELWNGKRLGVKKAKKLFCVDKVYSTDKFEKVLKKQLHLAKKLYYPLHVESAVNSKIKSIMTSNYKNTSLAYPTCYEELTHIVNRMRLKKDSHEIELIKKALKITKAAHEDAMSSALHVEREYELQHIIEERFKKGGAYSDAYTTIVASGNNANTLHYIKNSKKIKKSDLILIDAGCEFEMYASDITRTFPKSGKFTKEQRKLYDLVLKTQKKVIKKIKPNVLRSDLQKLTIKELTKGLIQLKILKGSLKKSLKKESVKKYYPHGIGHWMGLDVHDTNPYFDKKAKEIPLQKGMLLTIEPGIYLPKNDKDIPKKYRGIGIRIEDDILITKNSHENLSENIIKEADEIELFMQMKRKKR